MRFTSAPAPVLEAVPLRFEDVDLREKPDNPANRFRLEVPPGAAVAAIGDEDSGVGDLGRYSMGLDRPPQGRVLAFGHVIADLGYYQALEYRRRLGYQQTGDGLLQNLTLRANVSLPLQYASDHRVKEVVDRVEELLAQFEIADVADLRPADVNEEDRRKAAVARACALDPALLIMEAPFDGLTARAAAGLLAAARVRRDGSLRSVLLTSQHVASLVQRQLSRVVQVLDGLAVEAAN
jgi:ABC-type transporter Mla maintaining outer membrane lipid asymmetry ATPase subunit MlaF